MVRRVRILIASQAIIVGLCLSFANYLITRVEAQEQQLVPVASLEADDEVLFRLAWSPDSTRLAIATGYNEVQLYNTDLELVGQLQGHTDDVFDVAWSPDGTSIASTSLDDTLRIWNVATRQLLATINDFPGLVYRVSWSSDGERIATVAVDTSREPYSGPDNQYFAWTNITILNVSNPSAPTVEYSLPTMLGISTVGWNLDNSSLIVANNEAGHDSYITFWNVATGQQELERRFSGTRAIQDFARQPTSNLLAVAPNFREVTLYDPVNGRYIMRLPFTDRNLAVDWNSNGERLATSGEDGTINVWDIETVQALGTFNEPFGVYEVKWSPDDQHIASISGGIIVHIWDVSALTTPMGVPTATLYP